MQDAWFFHCVSTGSLVFPRLCNEITCSMQRLLCFDTDGFVSHTAVAQWNSHARTVLDFLRLQHGVFRKPIPNWTAFWNTECQFPITNGIAVWSLGKDSRSSLDSEIPALLVEVLCMLPSETSPCDTATTQHKKVAEIRDTTALLRERKKQSEISSNPVRNMGYCA